MEEKRERKEEKGDTDLTEQSLQVSRRGGVILSPEDPWQCIHRAVSSTRAPVPSTL